MKRSRKAKLVAMASIILLASGCEDVEHVGVYSDIEDCSKYNDANLCEYSFANAQQQHTDYAVQYENLSDCNTDFYHCEQVVNQNGSSTFVPMLMGYGMGYTHGSSVPLYSASNIKGGPLQTSGGVVMGHPSSSIRTNNVSSVYRSSVTPQQYRQAPLRTSMRAAGAPVNRGGFGTQAAARSSSSGG